MRAVHTNKLILCFGEHFFCVQHKAVFKRVLRNQTKSNYSGQSQHRDARNTMNQSELETNTCKRRQARENACEQGTIDFGVIKFSLVEKTARVLPTNHAQSVVSKTKANAKLPSTLN